MSGAYALSGEAIDEALTRTSFPWTPRRSAA